MQRMVLFIGALLALGWMFTRAGAAATVGPGAISPARTVPPPETLADVLAPLFARPATATVTPAGRSTSKIAAAIPPVVVPFIAPIVALVPKAISAMQSAVQAVFSAPPVPPTIPAVSPPPPIPPAPVEIPPSPVDIPPTPPVGSVIDVLTNAPTVIIPGLEHLGPVAASDVSDILAGQASGLVTGGEAAVPLLAYAAPVAAIAAPFAEAIISVLDNQAETKRTSILNNGWAAYLRSTPGALEKVLANVRADTVIKRAYADAKAAILDDYRVRVQSGQEFLTLPPGVQDAQFVYWPQGPANFAAGVGAPDIVGASGVSLATALHDLGEASAVIYDNDHAFDNWQFAKQRYDLAFPPFGLVGGPADSK